MHFQFFVKKFIFLAIIFYFFRKKINNKNLREVGRTCCFNFVHSSGSNYVLLIGGKKIIKIRVNTTDAFLCFFFLN